MRKIPVPFGEIELRVYTVTGKLKSPIGMNLDPEQPALSEPQNKYWGLLIYK